MILPAEAHPLPFALGPTFTYPTFDRFAALMAAAVRAPGRRTAANLLRALGPLADGHPTTYRRVLSSASWSGLRLGLALTRFLLHHLLPAGPVVLVGDGTADGHRGKDVYGKARHRDPVRSTRSYTAWRCGHEWAVPAVLVRFPFATRPRALPALADLYRCAEGDRRRERPHRTPAQLMCRLRRLLLLRFPGRRFVSAGDRGYGAHEVARFCRRRRGRLTPVSQLRPDANLVGPPPPYAGAGRPRVKGPALPKPRQAAAAARRRRTTVGWYGGGTRRVEVAAGTGRRYKSGRGLVPLRWVFVRDQSGTHRGEYLYATDPALLPEAVVGYSTGRWSIEKAQADCTSRGRWVGSRRIGYHRRDGVARAGRVVPATPGRSHRRSRMSDTTRRRPAPPRA
jgi:hypothetical protein